MDVARAYPSGHIGNTPQPTDALARSRVGGMLQDFVEHLEPPNTWRVDAYLGFPNVAQAAAGGYLRDQSTVAHIDEAVDQEIAHGPKTPAPKNFGGPNLFGD